MGTILSPSILILVNRSVQSLLRFKNGGNFGKQRPLQLEGQNAILKNEQNDRIDLCDDTDLDPVPISSGSLSVRHQSSFYAKSSRG